MPRLTKHFNDELLIFTMYNNRKKPKGTPRLRRRRVPFPFIYSSFSFLRR